MLWKRLRPKWKRTPLTRPFVITCLLTVACFAGQVEHQHHPPGSAEEYIKILNDPTRDAWQKPDEVIRAMALRPDEGVADIGSGGGYFTFRIAHHTALVYAVDIDQKLLDAVSKSGVQNVRTVLASTGDPKLPPQSVDTVFFCEVTHHIQNRPDYYRKIDQALRPGGRIVIIDFYKKKLPVGPPEAMKLSESQVIGELEAAGFRKTKTFRFLAYQFFMQFERQHLSRDGSGH
jgi:ubiquinone/menaquinone biosynthesis C-methylase UbiE